jgi:hypothetical protein
MDGKEVKEVYEGIVEVLGGYHEMPEIVYLGDDELIEIMKKYKGKNIKITIETI